MQASVIRVAGVAAMLLVAVSLTTACAITCVTTHCAPPSQAATDTEHHHHESDSNVPADPAPEKHDCGRSCPGVFVTSVKTRPIPLALGAPVLAPVNVSGPAFAPNTNIDSRDHAPPRDTSPPPLAFSVLRI